MLSHRYSNNVLTTTTTTTRRRPASCASLGVALEAETMIQEGTGSVRFVLVPDLFENSSVRFGSFPRPVPLGSGIKRFGSARFGRFGSVKPKLHNISLFLPIIVFRYDIALYFLIPSSYCVVLIFLRRSWFLFLPDDGVSEFAVTLVFFRGVIVTSNNNNNSYTSNISLSIYIYICIVINSNSKSNSK